MIPSALAGQLQRGLSDFLRYSFGSTTPGFEGALDALLDEPGGVLKGPFVQLFLPFLPGGRSDAFPEVPLDFTPHRHQEQAFARLRGDTKRSTLVATGTGSGKTECFLWPILDHCRARAGQPGIKAIVLYPMNALATDQALRIARTVHGNEALKGHVRVGLYIGDDGGAHGLRKVMGPDHVITDHATLKLHPPDILLTNYKMLDYLLLRPRDRGLWSGSTEGSLRFLVVDELHTFDGAQGTDLACLIRRLKDRLAVRAGTLCCVGTSATLGSLDGAAGLREHAARVFGEPFDAESVIGEARQDIDAFRGDTVLDEWKVPGKDRAAELDPSSAGAPTAWLASQAALWLESPPAGEPDSDEWTVELGERLRKHVVLDNLLRRLRGGPRAVQDLIAALGASPDLQADPTYGEHAVLSFVSLVCAARRWRPELPGAQARREAAGLPRPTDYFLQVRMQLWVRELRRMVASVATTPRLAFSDDLAPDVRRNHLPVIHCRECGVMGWATVIPRDRPRHLEVELPAFFRSWFSNDARIHYLFPPAAFEEAESYERLGGVLRLVDPERLVASRPSDVEGDESEDGGEAGPAAGPGGAPVPLVELNPLTEHMSGPKVSKDCVFCHAPGSFTLIGFQAATLTSSLIDQLFASPFNDDKKLLAFSDSVQDAAHRAGFFAARTWRINLRVALQRVLLEVGEVPLSELARRVVTWWREQGGLDEATYVGTFLGPNMGWLHEVTAWKETGVASAKLLDLVERRLVWEAAVEYGLQARVGRSLSRTGCSVAAVDPERVDAVATRLLEPLRNEVGGLRGLDAAGLAGFLAGFLVRLRERGAILTPELPGGYVTSGGEDTYAFKREVHLPNYGPQSRMPGLLIGRGRRRRFEDLHPASWPARWYYACFQRLSALLGDHDAVYSMVLRALVDGGVLDERRTKEDAPVWGIRPDALRVTTRARRVVCNRCGHRSAVGVREAQALTGAPCLSTFCRGVLEDRPPADDPFARLYRSGDLQRIVAEEHTGLLDRATRERIEQGFKAEGSARRPWFPNLLSCTPTLEMGIDIGALSTAVLCTMPPTQASYIQRVGRAGRRDGNALVLAVANARPHDLYYWTEPEHMLSGDVTPPGLFLDASAVLERQLTAFCLDRWAASGVGIDALPRTMKEVYAKLGKPEAPFPHGFRTFVEERYSELVKAFCALFGSDLRPETREHLATFARGGPDGNTLALRIVTVLEQEKKQVDDLRRKIGTAIDRIKQRKDNPVQDEASKKELRDLLREREALGELKKALENRDTLNFFTDEGLVPNYAFPEAAVRLRSVIWRKKQVKGEGESAYETWVYEYDRPGAAALAELAPSSTFYAGGRRVEIDQIDVETSTIESWRFCDACSHAEREGTGEERPCCPACKSAQWTDSGQVHELIRLRQVYAGTSDRDSRIQDDRDDRTVRSHFARQMFVTVHEADQGEAWQIDAEDLPFAFEFVRKATFREVNFGKSGTEGSRLTSIAGHRALRKGFTICKHCGKVQKGEEPVHALTCTARRKEADKNFAACVYLFRELESEAIRILIPVVEIAGERTLPSFMAAIDVGLRARFGGRVDHIEATIDSEPVTDTPLRKQFLVLYDKVPGGTGYLKELARDPANLFDVLRRARDRLASCRCAADPRKDGCHRCILSARSSHERVDVSRRDAVSFLTRILDHESSVRPVPSLGSVSVQGLLDSVLEARFVAALAKLGSAGRESSVRKCFVGTKSGWHWSIGDRAWTVEPQRELTRSSGLAIDVSIDFVLTPADPHARRPVAVFLDGWEYHREKVGTDMFRRMALLASGQYDVWCFTWQDIEDVLSNQVQGAVDVLGLDGAAEQVMRKNSPAELHLLRERMGQPTLRWFVDTLAGAVDDAAGRSLAWSALSAQLRPATPGVVERRAQYAPPALRSQFAIDLATGPWLAGGTDADDGLPRSLLALTTAAEVREDFAKIRRGEVPMGLRALVVLHDEHVSDELALRRAWQGYLRLFNLLRLLLRVWFTTQRGRELDLAAVRAQRDGGPARPGAGSWTRLQDDLDPRLHGLLPRLERTSLPIADEVGSDLPDARGHTSGAIAELLWSAPRVALAISSPSIQAVDPTWHVVSVEPATLARLESAHGTAMNDALDDLVTAIKTALGGRTEAT